MDEENKEGIVRPVRSTGKLKLPKYELVKFDGDPLKWQEFWDQFKISIDSNESISEVERFSYLKRYLDGSRRPSRDIHLEVYTSLKVDAFLRAFKLVHTSR